MSRLVLTEGGLPALDGTVASDSGMAGLESELLLVFLSICDPDVNGARFIATLRGHVGPVYRLTWSADSRQLVSASKDTTLKVTLPPHSLNAF